MGLLNGLKNEQKSVPLTNVANITTIFKKKGSQLDMKNGRGIFILPVFRMILEKRIYMDKYKFIDENMSDSNVGGRKERNIRNHLFIVYGIINSVVQKETGPVDIAIYDIAQCFDSMWLSETMNNIYDVLPKEQRDDKISLIYENNKKCELAINTPFGLTNRKTVENTV